MKYWLQKKRHSINSTYQKIKLIKNLTLQIQAIDIEHNAILQL